MKKHIYQDIQGWFTFPNLYKQMVEKFGNGSHFVEIGTWLGKSASYMAVEIENSGKNIRFDCVDTWRGSDEHKQWQEVVNDTLYQTFLKNIEPVKQYINPIRKPSREASLLYDDCSLDFVFIDAAHDYENVKNDIELWYPKVKSGGVLAGHDYEPTWKGLIQAVDEFILNNQYKLTIQSEYCWGIIKQ